MPVTTSFALMLALAGPASEAITLPSQPAPLHGTLLTPDDDTREAAVILPGSGPTDRDGNNTATGLVVRASNLRLLAEGLAAQGVATVRIDKRGIAESAAAGRSEAEARFSDYVADAREWAVQTAARTGRPCVWLIGHSEGALVALAAAVEDQREASGKVCGVVSLSGAGRPAHVVIGEQLQALPDPLKSQAAAGLADLAAGRETPAIPGLEMLFRPSVQPYLISWFALDPAALAGTYEGPLMIGQGTTDLQTTLADAQALHAARPSARLVVWQGVNHMLKTAPADRAANLASYADADTPLAPGVVDDVAAFILQPR